MYIINEKKKPTPLLGPTVYWEPKSRRDNFQILYAALVKDVRTCGSLGWTMSNGHE